MATAPYRKPDAFTIRVVQPILSALGLLPTLTVRGRTSGRAHSVPVLLLDDQGKRYVVAPRGNTQWARNLRAAGEAELKVGGKKRRVKATEIPVPERKSLVEAYRRQHAKRYGRFLDQEFAAIPDPADHPVFLLEDL